MALHSRKQPAIGFSETFAVITKEVGCVDIISSGPSGTLKPTKPLSTDLMFLYTCFLALFELVPGFVYLLFILPFQVHPSRRMNGTVSHAKWFINQGSIIPQAGMGLSKL